MDNTNDSSDTGQTYQLSRRDLIRACGAAAGVGAAGGIPAATGIEYPVGDADALAVSTAVVGAAVLGLGTGFVGGIAVSEMLDGGSDQELVEDTQDDVENKNNYDVVSAAGIAKNIERHAEKTGLTEADPLLDGGAVWDDGYRKWELSKPNDNPTAHTMMENGTAAVAETFQKGESKATAESNFRTEVDKIATTSLWSIIGSWNSFVRSIIPAWISDSGNEYGNIYHSTFTTHESQYDYRDPGQNGTATTGNPIPSSITEVEPVGLESFNKLRSIDVSGDWCPVHLRDISPYLPVSPSELDSNKVPDSGFKVLELGTAWVITGNDKSHQIISPYHVGTSDLTKNTGYFRDRYGAYETTYKWIPPLEMEVRYPPTSDTERIPLYAYGRAVDAVNQIHDNIIGNSATVVDNIYSGLQNGSLDQSDILSSRQLYQQYDQAGNFSRAAVTLMSYGNFDVPKGAVDTTVTVNGSKFTGLLFVDVPSGSTVNLSEGDILSAAEYNEARLLPSNSDKNQQVFSDSDITIKSINGSDALDYSSRDRIGPSGVDSSEIESDLKNLQERNEDLNKKIEELESEGPLGGGGRGSSLPSNPLILGGIGLGALYVIFGGGS